MVWINENLKYSLRTRAANYCRKISLQTHKLILKKTNLNLLKTTTQVFFFCVVL